MSKKAIVFCALVFVAAALLIPAGHAQDVAEFELSKPPAQAGAEPGHLHFTLAVRDPKISGARIYLAPSHKPHPSRRTWRYVGMVSFFPEGTNPHAMFALPVHGDVHGKQEMIAEPIAEGKTDASALQIVDASLVNTDE